MMMKVNQIMDDMGWAYGKHWKEEKDVWLLLGNLKEETTWKTQAEMGKCELYSSVSEQEKVVGSCEYGKEPSSLKKVWVINFLNS